MKYAVIRTGGKQYRVSEGDVIEVERLALTDKTVTFSDVLLYAADSQVMVGAPIVAGITVTGTLIADTKGVKIRVAKFKAKARFRRVTGHRQSLSQVKIESIGSGKATKAPASNAAIAKESDETKVKEVKVVKKSAPRTAAKSVKA